MTAISALCFGFAILLIINGNMSDAATRVGRSPQFSYSQSQASAQAGGFGGGSFGPPRPTRPHFRPQAHLARPGFGGGSGQGGFGNQVGFGGGQGSSISISKSVSISRGGVAQSSAQSSAAGK